MVRVKNVHGTSKEKYANSKSRGGKPWIDFWREKCSCSGFLDKCANEKCSQKMKVGAHVIKEGKENDRSWYIVPLCGECNAPSNQEYFEVDEDFLVPVTGKDTDVYDDAEESIEKLLKDIEEKFNF